jgi:hypothetical protein
VPSVREKKRQEIWESHNLGFRSRKGPTDSTYVKSQQMRKREREQKGLGYHPSSHSPYIRKNHKLTDFQGVGR